MQLEFRWRPFLYLLTLSLLAVIASASVYLLWTTRFQLPGEVFAVPPNTSVLLNWINNRTGVAKSIPLDAKPGEAIRILIEASEENQPELDALYHAMLKSEETPAIPYQPARELLKRTLGISVLSEKQLSTRKSRFQFQYMSSTHPVLQTLRAQEHLDDVIANASTEFEKFCALMTWSRQQLPEGVPNPYPKWNALDILKKTRSGVTEAFCAQYAQLLTQALISLGYQARYVGLSNHEVVEVWSNQYAKWIILDPFNCCYYRDGENILNALEIHRMLSSHKGDLLEMVRLDPQIQKNREEQIAQYMTFNVSMVNNHPEWDQSGMADVSSMWWRRVYWVDQYTETLPIDDGKIRMMTTFESDLYFDLNMVEMGLAPVERGVLRVSLSTFTPEFLRFERKVNDLTWQETPNTFEWRLSEGDNVLQIRAVNAQNVTGPIGEIAIHFEG